MKIVLAFASLLILASGAQAFGHHGGTGRRGCAGVAASGCSGSVAVGCSGATVVRATHVMMATPVTVVSVSSCTGMTRGQARRAARQAGCAGNGAVMLLQQPQVNPLPAPEKTPPPGKTGAEPPKK